MYIAIPIFYLRNLYTYIRMYIYVYVYIFNILIYSVCTVYTVLYAHRSTLYTYYALKYLATDHIFIIVHLLLVATYVHCKSYVRKSLYCLLNL